MSEPRTPYSISIGGDRPIHLPTLSTITATSAFTTNAVCVTPEKRKISQLPEGSTAARSLTEDLLNVQVVAGGVSKEQLLLHQSEDGDDDDDDDNVSIQSNKSIRQHHGRYGDDQQDVPWKGCVCGLVHKRPTKVFWIQCEGACQTWYNVASMCVDGMTQDQASQSNVIWNCRSCTNQWQSNPILKCLLQDMPNDVWLRILEFVAVPTYRASVLCHQVAALNKAARHFVQSSEQGKGVWECLLQNDYLVSSTESSSNHRNTKPAPNALTKRRSSKRRRVPTNFLAASKSNSPTVISTKSNDHPRHLVEHHHLLLLCRTEEVYHLIQELADPFNGASEAELAVIAAAEAAANSAPIKHDRLTLNRLKNILDRHPPINVNRPSPSTGRTMLQVVCAGEMAEGVVVSCAQYLVSRHNADPNVYSTEESPYVDRPALYFAISRAMPKLVQTLINAGAWLDSQISGKLQMTFDTSQIVDVEALTPLLYARTMWQVEIVEAGQNSMVPPYWVNKMNACTQALESACSSGMDGESAGGGGGCTKRATGSKGRAKLKTPVRK